MSGLDHAADASNIWATLPVPWSDIFWHEIIPFLHVEDFVPLSAVNRRYAQLLGKQPRFTNSSDEIPLSHKTLSQLLLREARQEYETHHHHDSRRVTCRNQLPTLGNLSESESLKQNPWGVAQLRHAALRRRRLVRLEYNDSQRLDATLQTEASVALVQQQLAPIFQTFQPQSERQIIQALRQYDLDGTATGNVTPRTDFICINQSNTVVYCHWIDFDGTMLVREGDRIEPWPHADGGPDATNDNNNSHDINYFQKQFTRRQGQALTEVLPPHIFRHCSMASHSFALCRESGGRPFAIYQQRRCWDRVIDNASHAHALVMENDPMDMDNVVLREVHFDTCFRLSSTGHVVCLHSRVDRDTGQVLHVPGRRNPNTNNPNNQHLDNRPYHVDRGMVIQLDHSLIPSSSSPSNIENQEQQEDSLEHVQNRQLWLAKRFYGTNVPSISRREWRQGAASIARMLLQHLHVDQEAVVEEEEEPITRTARVSMGESVARFLRQSTGRVVRGNGNANALTASPLDFPNPLGEAMMHSIEAAPREEPLR